MIKLITNNTCEYSIIINLSKKEKILYSQKEN